MLLPVVFRYIGQCLGVRHKPRPAAASSARIARDTESPRASLWSRLVRTLFFWRSPRMERARTRQSPRITYVPTPPPLSDRDTARSIVESLAPLAPDALEAFCRGCSRDTLQAMVDWCRAPGNGPAADDTETITAKGMIEAKASEALRAFEPDGLVPPGGVRHVLTQLHRALVKVRDGKGVLDLARLRDDWVSRHPRDREFVAGGCHAANMFDRFRRSVEALCRFAMADGDPAATQALAAQWVDAAAALCEALEAGRLTGAAMAEHADALRLQQRETALALLRGQLGIAWQAPGSSPSDGAEPDEAAQGAPGAGGKARNHGATPLAARTLMALLLDPGCDAERLDAAVDSLVHNLRTVARQREREAFPADIAARLDELLARGGARLTEPQLHRLGDALLRAGLSAWGTCRKLLDIREALYETGNRALRDAMAGIAGVRVRQSAVREQAQLIWRRIGLVDAEVTREAGPAGAMPRDGTALG